jgi:ABC-2 type transport system ATP-binding protein/lipopolysaccharide transport system ATP-binding protein
VPAPTVISIENVSKRYLLGEQHTSVRDVVEGFSGALRGHRQQSERSELWALRDLSLQVAQGESVGIIGRNGAGKSTLLKVLTRITEPTLGVSRTLGRVGALLEVGTGFHAELTGRENIYLNGAIIGMRRKEVRRRFDEIVAFSGVERFVDTPVKRYSSGMYLRLAFGVAAHLDADIMVVDEVLAVGDAEFQRKCLAKMADIERSGRTVLFVSHNIEAIARLCSRVVWLDQGRVVLDGPTNEIIDQYLTAALAGDLEPVVTSNPGAPISVEQVRLLDRRGQPATILPRDAPFICELVFTLEQDVADLNLSIVVGSVRGGRLLDEAWSDHEDPTLRSAGRYRLRLTIPSVLNAGDYTLGLWIGTPYDTLVWAETVLTFRLEGSTQGRPERALQLGLQWAATYEEPGNASSDGEP